MRFNWHSRITLRDAVLPLFVLYLSSWVFLSQTAVSTTSKEILFLKLLAGLLFLGVPSWLILCKKSDRRIPLFPARIDWHLAGFSILSGLLILYTFLWVELNIFPGNVTKFLSYYGDYSVAQPLFFPIFIVLALYVMAEELYFRGVLYEYFGSKVGMWWGAILSIAAFGVAHLNYQTPYVILLIALASLATVLLEYSGVFFYGFLVHATLDLMSLFVNMSSLYGIFYPNLPLRVLVLGIATATYGTYLLKRRGSFKRMLQ